MTGKNTLKVTIKWLLHHYWCLGYTGTFDTFIMLLQSLVTNEANPVLMKSLLFMCTQWLQGSLGNIIKVLSNSSYL